jgi:hypothetical protein
VIERAILLLVWRNWCKRFSERKDGGSPAMRAGLARRRYRLRELLEKRLFVTRTALPEAYREYYFGMLDTMGIARSAASPASGVRTP